jgi:small GTP-binding protein
MVIQCILIGDTGVGKTSIITQARPKAGGKAKRSFPTIGVDFQHYRFLETDLNIWDTSGDKNFHPLIRMFEKQCKSIVYVFDATSPTSFQSICDWHSELYNPEKKYFCICNKIDLASSKEFGTRITHLYPEMMFLESSTDMNSNCDRILQSIIENSTSGNVEENSHISTISECCIIS